MKTCLVSGANSGIGRVTAEQLAKRGMKVWLACRSLERAQPVLDAIVAAGGAAELVALDLSDLASVRACADVLLERGEPLDLLVNNAGLAGARGLTKDGFELAFGTNHVGPYLLTRRVMPLLEAAPEGRIVVVASASSFNARGIDWDAVRKSTASATGLPEYAVSKLANILFARELSRRVKPTVLAFSVHPGVVASDAWREVPWGIRHLMKAFMLSNEEGAKTTIFCATSDDVKDKSGRYFDKSREHKPPRLVGDLLAAELWERTAAWTGLEP
jgi:NAD(P)-dependent dehydrogenase (short-subunit alcohol dehydrogenase family)